MDVIERVTERVKELKRALGLYVPDHYQLQSTQVRALAEVVQKQADSIDALEDEMDDLEVEIDALEDEMDDLEVEIDALEDEIGWLKRANE